ncbi:hypothetical protein G7Y89_g13847 [Cudoniella acicularis]|uniref:Uncharacterized protein n=1 Tax=Cudoniella acicularis TaxID=354080 RepID=A0A8H4R8W5_9HELO|nr:hypothetical protein G7Y89_g13847 [Cudoniella acicularis]
MAAMEVAKHFSAQAGMAAASVEQSGVMRPATATQVVLAVATGELGTDAGIMAAVVAPTCTAAALLVEGYGGVGQLLTQEVMVDVVPDLIGNHRSDKRRSEIVVTSVIVIGLEDPELASEVIGVEELPEVELPVEIPVLELPTLVPVLELTVELPVLELAVPELPVLDEAVPDVDDTKGDELEELWEALVVSPAEHPISEAADTKQLAPHAGIAFREDWQGWETVQLDADVPGAEVIGPIVDEEVLVTGMALLKLETRELELETREIETDVDVGIEDVEDIVDEGMVDVKVPEGDIDVVARLDELVAVSAEVMHLHTALADALA